MGLPSMISKNTSRSDANFFRLINLFIGDRAIQSRLYAIEFLYNRLHSLCSKGVSNVLCMTMEVDFAPWNDNVNILLMGLAFELLLLYPFE